MRYNECSIPFTATLISSFPILRLVLKCIDLVRSLISLFLVLSLVLCYFCKTEPEKLSLINPVGDTLTLVKSHCGRCHSVPDPASLDRATWNQSLLKNMGCRLGIQTDGYDPYRGMDMLEQSLLLSAGIYPAEPTLSQGDWEKIVTYYSSHAPDSLFMTNDSSVALKQFSPQSKGGIIKTPRVTMLFYDSIAHEIQVGLESGRVLTLSTDWKVTKEMNLGTTPIQYIPGGADDPYVLAVGVLYPSEQKNGSLIRLVNNNRIEVLTQLHRPVWMTLKDLNQDTKEDFIVSEFGYETGQLSWFDAAKPGQVNPQILFKGAGSIKTLITDLNADGINELVSLGAQGLEHVAAYMVNSNGKVEERRLINFPAIFGVCDLDVLDFNGDKLVDISVSNGDNADYSKITKPYHGIRVYLNQGNFVFKESVFIPYPGVLHSEIDDFDLDGDLDIAAVSFFPGDPAYPFPGFKYFEQVSPGVFSGQTFKTANQGKWMNMVKGDFDRDGDEDLLLGSFILNTIMVTGTREELENNSLLLLENKKIR